MYLNQGDGTFVDVTKKTGTDDERWSTSAAFFDYDQDGWLDLMVLNYADFSVTRSPVCYATTTARDYCTPRVFRAPGNRLFHNKGNGTFEDVTVNAGIDKEFGHGLGVGLYTMFHPGIRRVRTVGEEAVDAGRVIELKPRERAEG